MQNASHFLNQEWEASLYVEFNLQMIEIGSEIHLDLLTWNSLFIE